MSHIYDAIAKNEWIVYCIGCGRYGTKIGRIFEQCEMPQTYENTTGGICNDCMNEYKARKLQCIVAEG